MHTCVVPNPRRDRQDPIATATRMVMDADRAYCGDVNLRSIRSELKRLINRKR